jgi:ferredoxin-NADP reductase
MAVAKKGRVTEIRPLSPQSRVLTLELEEPLGFVGGQYLIFDSGVVLEGGKLAKRAYSILSSDAEQRRVEVAVRRIGDGPGSSFMHRAEVGSVLPFSGPWGKYLPDDARPRRSWLLATDTGISCALGLITGERFTPQRAQATLRWLVESDDYFLPSAWVRERLPAALGAFAVHQAPPADHPERLAYAEALVDALLREEGLPDSVFLSGDGAILFPLVDKLTAAGLPEGAVRTESYFHHKARKSA